MNVSLMSDIVDYGILGILAFMSFLVLYFWIERLLFYRSIKLEEYDTLDELELEISNHLSTISSMGANAPYIGLLGTVLAVIITFYTLGQSGNMDVKSIMTSLALALKATAMGLAVAIPAIFFYNHLNRKSDVLITRWKIMHKKRSNKERQ
ncbi:MAG: TonB-system energizer ExbB [Campylobacterota bacterium]|nr:TonB-system energizer ExbB [Campylobacterota bacterium]